MQQYIDTFMPFSTRNLLSADSLTKGLFEIWNDVYTSLTKILNFSEFQA